MAIDSTHGPVPASRLRLTVAATVCAVVSGLVVLVVGVDAAAAHGIVGAVALAFIVAQISWLAAALLMTVRGMVGIVDDEDDDEDTGCIRLEIPFGLIGNAENDDVEDAPATRAAPEAQIVQLRRAR